jgi:hypothetical protein
MGYSGGSIAHLTSTTFYLLLMSCWNSIRKCSMSPVSSYPPEHRRAPPEGACNSYCTISGLGFDLSSGCLFATMQRHVS